MSTNMKWFDLTNKNVPSGTKYNLLCPIIKPEADGGTWKNLPIHEELSYGWRWSDNSLTVLDMSLITSFDPSVDPNNFEFLFQKEADSHERNLIREAATLQNPSDRVSSIRTANTTFIKRIVRRIRLLNQLVFADPDPNKYMVLVACTNPTTILDGDEGSLWLRPDAKSISKVKLSPSDVLGNTNG